MNRRSVIARILDGVARRIAIASLAAFRYFCTAYRREYVRLDEMVWSEKKKRFVMRSQIISMTLDEAFRDATGCAHWTRMYMHRDGETYLYSRRPRG